MTTETNEVIQKTTNNDKFGHLSDAINKKYDDGDGCCFRVYLTDSDDTYAYFREQGDTYRVSYSTNDDQSITVADDKRLVLQHTEYTPVEDESIEKSVEGFVTKALNKFFGGRKKTQDVVFKSLNEESMIAIEPLYVPPNTADGVGEAMTESEIVKMVDSFNKANEEGRLKSNLFHEQTTEGFSVIKAWVTPYECTIDETPVEKGQPIVEIQFNCPDLWEDRKAGNLGGLSIGAMGQRTEA